MGYYTKSKYRGDYYFRPMKGDWYGARGRGDLWDDISGALGQGADFVKDQWRNLFPPQLGGPPKALPPPELPAIIQQSTLPPRFAQQLGTQRLNAPASAAMLDAGGQPGPNYTWRAPYMVSGAWVGPRHMNPLNPRALRRALRRAGSFRRICGKVLKLTGEKRHIKGFKGLTSKGFKSKRKALKVA